ncbi:flagellar hook-basal body complex protein FliE (plasmid) [Sphingomonas paeninsulae]|uniref:Flagellar hook-basal body complex protein FliE n=1 Tax=Sphingomonas paeninsulae TaxID=2319844 RepID=A0A494THA7_SPHPE|nr:flagellar hook-basal body complex protein FliE [Sphingomonas paeninsulae]AYJ85226.1 flagellar hook-basal body complex protein FliE [Sphingomonas paeninsulae]
MSGIDASGLMAMRGAVLARSEALQKVAKDSDATRAAAPIGAGFGQMLSEVNTLQAKANTASEAFERGDQTDIASVMLARQKASISFEATLQVRNKLLSAYRDIMNMPA